MDDKDVSKQDVLKWLDWPEDSAVTADKILADTRVDMQKALTNFHDHVKHFIYLMFAVPSAILAITNIFDKEHDAISDNIAAGLLIAMLFVGFISVKIIQRYYHVYLSALLFAVSAHRHAHVAKAHPLFQSTINQILDWKADSYEKFLNKRCKSPHSSCMLYSAIIIILSCLDGVLGGFFIFDKI